MPAGDRTGPDGRGPMTGRRRGFCAGNDAPGHMYPGPGMGRGRGRGWGGGRGRGRGLGHGLGPGLGRGQGRGRGYPVNGPHKDDRRVVEIPAPVYVPRPETQDEHGYLEQYAKELEEELALVRRRLTEPTGTKDE